MYDLLLDGSKFSEHSLNHIRVPFKSKNFMKWLRLLYQDLVRLEGEEEKENTVEVEVEKFVRVCY